ncbi:MAG: NADPH:quinone oxidoreductase family protein [Thermoleophilia bacterium]|nr:NADPH:quinone oxidoreductase family protein [Thermoleophilia bacterium]
MKAIVLREVGGELALEDVAEPEDGAILDVRAAGVNFADVLIRRGLYPQMPPLPYVLGNEVAGDLEGRRVLALPRAAGGYAERVEVDPHWTFPLPDNASYAAGASFLTTYLTAHIPLVHQLHISARSVVLVHAGSGGVGSAAIELAKLRGATVIATASSEEKRAFAREVGADQAVGYDEIDDLRVDVVIDPVGGDIFTRSLPLLNPLGTIVAIGFAGGLWEDPSVQWLVGRNAAVVGVYLGRLMKLRPELVHEAAEELLTLWARGEIDPRVGSTFALGDAGDAHALIESRRHVGKVVLEP